MARTNPTTLGNTTPGPEHFPAPQHADVNIADLIGTTAEPIATDTESLSRMSEADAKNKYLADLQFNENPVTVVIPAGHGKDAPKFVYCAVQGIGAEVWNPKSNTWMRFTWLPVASVITVKRKYLEVLARARVDTVETREVTTTPHANQDGYMLHRETHQAAPFYVRHDPAGEAGAEWYKKVMTEF